MPGYKGHIIGGLLAFIIFIFVAVNLFDAKEPSIWAISLVVCVLFALWPDVDTDSKGQTLFYSGFILVDLVLIYIGNFKWAALLGLFAMLPVVGHHRGWTHHILSAILIPSPILFVPRFFFDLGWAGLPVYLAGVTGYISHLALDRKFF